MTVEVVLPLEHADDVMTDAAVAGLIGQSPMVLATPGDWASPLGRATVIAARCEAGQVYLTLEAPERLGALHDEPTVRLDTLYPRAFPPASSAPLGTADDHEEGPGRD